MCGLRMLAAKQSSGSHLKWFCPTIGANTLAAEISRGFESGQLINYGTFNGRPPTTLLACVGRRFVSAVHTKSGCVSAGFGRSGLKGSANTQARATTRVQINASLLSANELTGCHANI